MDETVSLIRTFRFAASYAPLLGVSFNEFLSRIAVLTL